MGWGLVRVAALAGVVFAALIAFLLARKPFGHKTIVRAYFSDAMNLRPGARVRLAGVDIGSVETVRARPELKEAPAEVVMVLSPSYDLKIPNDSTASLATAGILGETYVQIDVGRASGAPIGTDTVLKTTGAPQLTTQDVLEKFGDNLSRKCGCDSDRKNNATGRTSTSKNASKR